MPLRDPARRDRTRPSAAAARPVRAVTGVLAGLVLAGASLALAGPAAAESQVSITDDSGATVTDVVAGSVVHLAGSGFQSVQGGTGGIYVTFGWVDDAASGTWRPSEGGATGLDYLYAPDVEGAGNAGFQRYVAFPGSSTESAANGGVIAADGSWATDLTIPAASFEAMDRDGNAAPVDCAQVQCGFITVGAHGVKNANNETFAPVTFADAAAEPAPVEAAPEDSVDPTTEGAPEATASVTAEADDSTETITAISAEPVDPDDDASARRTFILSMVGGFLTIAVLIYLGVRRARANRAAQAEPEVGAEPTTDSPAADLPTTDFPTDDDASR
ncbi:hypothetical protein SAMN05216410_3485 [Sanguibacter gelidistatuariae]|uniref:Htaa protein n=1 Tax=Sanguibacter gelidistatuariae TaxID=1814289 RepID=A0A1G6VMU6_9MICO|nr:hypothetical protein [Sanguibacter gelidistatuariae]SDD54864.1 hypothetical protein SAMN05216410_3485 [Sanguibacter gelidistatuariae]